MPLTLEITPAALLDLVRRKTLEDGELALRIQFDEEAELWRVVSSGWRPLNDLEAPDLAALLRALAIVFEGDRVALVSGSDASRARLAPPIDPS